MAQSISQKLRIEAGNTLLTLNAPADFKKCLGALPAGVKISADTKDYNQLHWFIMNKAQLAKEVNKVLKLVKDDVILWIYYPKGTSKIQTDLNRDSGWEALMKNDQLTFINLISFDDTWSAFGARLKTEKEKKKAAQSRPEREIFNWVNPQTKEVILPDDLAAVLKRNKKQYDFFKTLSFTNKKEYIEWIVTAKREETRAERLKGTIEKLDKEWKNPRNI
ncbi:MAG TPA: YdeI/OmpD-associated family protein [Chitinophagaceae bacterium]|nr:YdeI/OmpD-associated family protein [Chitinophagaceae bacterium]